MFAWLRCVAACFNIAKAWAVMLFIEVFLSWATDAPTNLFYFLPSVASHRRVGGVAPSLLGFCRLRPRAWPHAKGYVPVGRWGARAHRVMRKNSSNCSVHRPVSSIFGPPSGHTHTNLVFGDHKREDGAAEWAQRKTSSISKPSLESQVRFIESSFGP